MNERLTYIKKGIHNLFGICITLVFFTTVAVGAVETENIKSDNSLQNTAKIHFISLHSTTDAILLESNGHYGMIDSGEDWDYPDGDKYKLRDGVTTEIGFEQQVIHYLEQLGVEQLDFYIATHSHSDHIGSADEILYHFPVERLYIGEYKDAYLTGAYEQDEGRLWDNQYVYDCAVRAAELTGTQIITASDLQENEQYRVFTMEDMTIELLNFEREKDENGNIIPVFDENCNSLVTLVSAYGKNALLTSDLDPSVQFEGGISDTVKIADFLIDKFSQQSGEETANSKTAVSQNEIPVDYAVDLFSETDKTTKIIESRIEQDDETDSEEGLIDESQINTGVTISLDLMKLAHHGSDYNNTTYFLTSLNPKTVVGTGYEEFFNSRMQACLPETETYFTATDSAAVVAEFTEDGIDTEYVKTEPDWMVIDGERYYFDENGRTVSGYQKINNEEYCFNKQGSLDKTAGWVQDTEGYWHFWNGEGEYLKEEWIDSEKGNKYYFDENGIMLAGAWKEIEGKWYYFRDNGKLATNVFIGDYFVGEDGTWDPNVIAPHWELIDNEWYYYQNGGYVTSIWKNIDGKWYYFDHKGRMATEWKLWNSKWYYLGTDGAMRIGWQLVSGNWYYLDLNGVMQTGWLLDGSTWYYLAESGAMQTGWLLDGNSWYYLAGSGVMRTGWVLDGSTWYYLGENGAMQTGWVLDGSTWYYLAGNGAMRTGWVLDGNTWYYLAGNGAMQTSRWIGDYYVQADGSMAVNKWVGIYYVGADGKWLPGKR